MQIFNITHILAKRRTLGTGPLMLTEHFGNDYLYCGWGNKRLGLESSPLANPYSHKSNARADRRSVASRDHRDDAVKP